ncbi:MAG: hypothetical protein U0228_18100 [Myxococcaceae bacterium]
MEQPAPAPKQRSPLFYVLIGCGGLAGLICLGGAVVLLGLGKVAKDVTAGMSDPEEMRKNATRQLGAVPEGYNVVASVNMFVLEMTLLTDAPARPDGGFDLDDKHHTFTYFEVMANQNNKTSRDFLMGKETDPQALARSGINIDAHDVIKRGQLNIDGRKVYWTATRGKLEMGAQAGTEGINTAVLFDCATDDMRVGVWSQKDPAPDKASDQLELAGTVADEAELVRFLKPMNPCAR